MPPEAGLEKRVRQTLQRVVKPMQAGWIQYDETPRGCLSRKRVLIYDTGMYKRIQKIIKAMLANM